MAFDLTDEPTEKAIAKAVGAELRRAREEGDWTRNELVETLPSGIGERTLLSYEHGTRHLTVLRFIELCNALGMSTPTVLQNALQRAEIHLRNLTLQIDLKQLLKNRNEKFRSMHQWARNKLNEYPEGVVEVAPESVRELATFVGCGRDELAKYLAKFIPEKRMITTEVPSS